MALPKDEREQSRYDRSITACARKNDVSDRTPNCLTQEMCDEQEIINAQSVTDALIASIDEKMPNRMARHQPPKIRIVIAMGELDRRGQRPLLDFKRLMTSMQNADYHDCVSCAMGDGCPIGIFAAQVRGFRATQGWTLAEAGGCMACQKNGHDSGMWYHPWTGKAYCTYHWPLEWDLWPAPEALLGDCGCCLRVTMLLGTIGLALCQSCAAIDDHESFDLEMTLRSLSGRTSTCRLTGEASPPWIVAGLRNMGSQFLGIIGPVGFILDPPDSLDELHEEPGSKMFSSLDGLSAELRSLQSRTLNVVTEKENLEELELLLEPWSSPSRGSSGMSSE